MAHKILPSQEYLRQCLKYDPETGALTWKERPIEHFRSVKASREWNGRFAGRIAGCIHENGYWFVYFDGTHYRAHRLIWKMMTGEDIPEIDHRDLNRSNNRWENLRAATGSQQRANRIAPSTKNGGTQGVRAHHNRFTARIKVHRREIHLGSFKTREEAKTAYDKAALEYFGEFARL